MTRLTMEVNDFDSMKSKIHPWNISGRVNNTVKNKKNLSTAKNLGQIGSLGDLQGLLILKTGKNSK